MCLFHPLDMDGKAFNILCCSQQKNIAVHINLCNWHQIALALFSSFFLFTSKDHATDREF